MDDTRELNREELNNVSGGVGDVSVDWDAIISRLTDLCPRCNHCMPLNKSIMVINATIERLYFDTRCCGHSGVIFPSGEVKFIS